MIKLSKDSKPMGEYFSIYNAIEALQGVMNETTPDVIYPAKTSVSVLVNNNTYLLEVENEKQVNSVVKWVESFKADGEE